MNRLDARWLPGPHRHVSTRIDIGLLYVATLALCSRCTFLLCVVVLVLVYLSAALRLSTEVLRRLTRWSSLIRDVGARALLEHIAR